MEAHLIESLRWLIGLSIGGAIGFAFGKIQTAANQRYARLQQEGKLGSGLAVVPGSMSRVAYLLVALAIVQVVCPMLFVGTSQWWVSAGVAVGYGFELYRNSSLRTRLGRVSGKPE